MWIRYYYLGTTKRSAREDNGTPLQYSCLANPMDGGAWWAAVHGVARSPTWLSSFTFTFHFHALEKEMATHSSVLAWRIPGTGEPGGLLSMGSHRVGHDWSDLAAQRGVKAEDMGKGSIPGRPHSILLCYTYAQRKGISLFWRQRHQEGFQETGLAKFHSVYYTYLMLFDLSYFYRAIYSLSDLT